MSGGVGPGGIGGGSGGGGYPGGPGPGPIPGPGGHPQYPYQAPQPIHQQPVHAQYPQQPVHQQQNPDHFRETVAPGVKLFGQSLGLSLGFFLGIVLVFVLIPILLCGGCVMMGACINVAEDRANRESRDSVQRWQNQYREPTTMENRSLEIPSSPAGQADDGIRVLPGGGVSAGR